MESQDLFSASSTTARCARVAPKFHDRNSFFIIVTNLMLIKDSMIVDLAGDDQGSMISDLETKIDDLVQGRSKITVTAAGCDQRRARGPAGWLAEKLENLEKVVIEFRS